MYSILKEPSLHIGFGFSGLEKLQLYNGCPIFTLTLRAGNITVSVMVS